MAVNKDILELALKIIDEHGWIKGQIVNMEGNRCLMGACELACNFLQVDFQVDFQDTLNYLSDVAQQHYPERIPNDKWYNCSVPKFNDHADTTLDDVRNLVGKAIADL